MAISRTQNAPQNRAQRTQKTERVQVRQDTEVKERNEPKPTGADVQSREHSAGGARGEATFRASSIQAKLNQQLGKDDPVGGLKGDIGDQLSGQRAIEKDPSKFAGREAEIGSANNEYAAKGLRAMDDAGNARAGEELDAMAERAPSGYSGSRIREATGMSDEVRELKGDVQARDIRQAQGTDKDARGAAMSELGDKAANKDARARQALVEMAAGDVDVDYSRRDAVSSEAGDALAKGGAKDLTADQADKLLLRKSEPGAKTALVAAMESGNPHVADKLREEAASSAKYGHNDDDKGTLLAAPKNASKEDLSLALKVGEPRFSGEGKGKTAEAVGARMKAGDQNARAAVEENFTSEDFKQRTNALDAAKIAPEAVSASGVDTLKEQALKSDYPHQELGVLEEVAGQRTEGGARARGALKDLSAKHEEAGRALERAQHASQPDEGKALYELQKGQPLTDERAERIVSGFGELSPDKQRETIDTLKRDLGRETPSANTYETLGKLAPHLSASDVKDIANSSPRMPDFRSRDAEKYYSSRVQSEKNIFKNDTDRMGAKREALATIVDNGGSEAAREAAFDGLVDKRFDKMDAKTVQSLERYASESGDTARGLKLQERVPGAQVAYKPNAHRDVPMNDERARAVFADPNKWSALDSHNGVRPEGRITREQMAAAAKDERLPPDVRAAAGYASRESGTWRRLSNADQVLQRAETAGFKGGEGPGFQYLQRDGQLERAETSRKFLSGGTTESTAKFDDGDAVKRTTRFHPYSTTDKTETGKIDARSGRFNAETKHETTTRAVGNETDVDGVDWLHGLFGSDSPQDLRDQLGNKGVRREVTTTTSKPRYGKETKQETERFYKLDSQGRLDKEMTRTSTDGGPNQWTARSRNSDGTYDSQTFFQGTEDTITTKHKTTADGWKTAESQARFSDTREAALKAKKDGHNIAVPPARTDNVSMSKDGVTARELESKLSEAGLGSAKDQEAYKAFVERAGAKGFSVSIDRTTDSDGNREARLLADDGKGNRLAIALDPESGATTSQTETADNQALLSRTERNGERSDLLVKDGEAGLEAFTKIKGGAFKKDKETTDALNESRGDLGHARTALDRARKLGGNVDDLGRGLASAGRNLGKLGKPVRGAGVALRGIIDKATKGGGARLGRGIDKVLVGAGAVSGALATAELFDGIRKGDAKKIASGASNVAVDASNAMFGYAGLAKQSASHSARLGTVLKASRFLGFAGGVGQVGLGVHEMFTGDKFKGGMNTAAGVGTLMATAGTYGAAAGAGSAWASVGWMGPVGAGVALAATGLLMGYGHVEETKIARPEVF